MVAAEARRLRLWQDRIETEVAVEGEGPPLVYLHGQWGLRPDREFVTRLAQTHTVYAPRHPGTTSGDPDAIHELDHWWDLVVYYAELFDRLELRAPALVGSSFGGLLACELAATLPERVGKLVLIDPVGLWRDELPVKNPTLVSPVALRSMLFANPDGAAAQRFFNVPDDPAERAAVLIDTTWSQACVGKFVWPLPDKGLKKHTHRITAPTLILWGKQDGIIAPAYADDFAQRIAGAQVELLDGAAHLPHLEQPETVARLVTAFLTDGARKEATPTG